MNTINPVRINVVTFSRFLLLVFVLFSLYLMRDAFFRWDGFSYYASFLEFIPSVALALILWTIVSLFAAVVIWLFFRVFEWASDKINLKITVDHLLLQACIFVMLGVLTWKGKKIIWPDVQTALSVKIAVLASVFLLSIYMTWILRKKVGQCVKVVLESITPLVWLFGIILLLSVPLVTYHTWVKGADSEISREAARDPVMNEHRPNIILVTFDALAARNMSLYGYTRETTPFISKWAEGASVFNRVVAGSNFTTPAVASLMTGKRVWTHQTYHIAGTKPVRSNVESLPSILKKNGYFNMAFIANPFASVRVLGMDDCFDTAPLTSEFGEPASLFGWKFGIVDVMLYRIFGDKIRLHNWILKNDFILSKVINFISRNISLTTVPPQKTFDIFLDTMDDSHQKPIFAWIHLFPPHDPYLPPEPFEGTYNPSQKLRTYKKQEKLIEESYDYLFQYSRLPEEMQPSADLMRDYYDEFITYVDKAFEDFIAEVNKMDIGNTIIILTADHGESFEHGYFTHGGPFLYEQVTHVPLIIKEADPQKGVTVDTIVEQIDIPATVLDLAGIPVPSWMEGRSLVPLIRGERLTPRPAFSMNFEGNRSRQHIIKKGSIAVWEGHYKLIHYLERDESLLFNLKNDPDELSNIFDEENKTGRLLLGLIKENLSDANERMRRIK